MCSTIGVNIAAGLTRSGAEQLPSELPGLARDVAVQVREGHPDALLFKIRVERKQDPDTPSAKHDVWLYFFSSVERLVIQVSGMEIGRGVEWPLFEVEDKARLIPVPNFSIDLPTAVRTARNSASMPGELAQGELSVKVPVGRLPVLVWSLQSTVVTPPRYFFVDALTGTPLTVKQVSGPTATVDPTLESSEEALKQALRREAKRSPTDASLWMQFVVKPILDANNIFECNALGGAWTLLRMCIP